MFKNQPELNNFPQWESNGKKKEMLYEKRAVVHAYVAGWLRVGATGSIRLGDRRFEKAMNDELLYELVRTNDTVLTLARGLSRAGSHLAEDS